MPGNATTSTSSTVAASRPAEMGRVTSVEKDRCIANVMPGSKITEVLEGDQVIPAHPES